MILSLIMETFAEGREIFFQNGEEKSVLCLEIFKEEGMEEKEIEM